MKGAHHIGSETDDKQLSEFPKNYQILGEITQECVSEIDIDTFQVAWELSNPGSATEEYFMRIPQTEYLCDKDFRPRLDHLPDVSSNVHPTTLCDTSNQFREIPQNDLPPGVAHGYQMTTITIDTPKYLLYLASRFTGSGGRLLRGSIQHIQQVVDCGENLFSKEITPTPPDAVVVCTGLGSRFLGGVEDKDVYPIRGQTVLIKAPWIKFGLARLEADETLTYIIPRSSGDVIGSSHMRSRQLVDGFLSSRSF